MSTKRILISVDGRVLEIEGEDAWVDRYQEDINLMLLQLRDVGAPTSRIVSQPQSAAAMPKIVGGSDSEDFGEVLLGLPNSATATDQMLLAGLFAQRTGGENSFATKDASGLLLEQGVKIGNPSQCMTNNLKAKRVFKVGASYRVSKTGIEYLGELQAKG